MPDIATRVHNSLSSSVAADGRRSQRLGGAVALLVGFIVAVRTVVAVSAPRGRCCCSRRRATHSCSPLWCFEWQLKFVPKHCAGWLLRNSILGFAVAVGLSLLVAPTLFDVFLKPVCDVV